MLACGCSRKRMPLEALFNEWAAPGTADLYVSFEVEIDSAYVTLQRWSPHALRQDRQLTPFLPAASHHSRRARVQCCIFARIQWLPGLVFFNTRRSRFCRESKPPCNGGRRYGGCYVHPERLGASRASSVPKPVYSGHLLSFSTFCGKIGLGMPHMLNRGLLSCLIVVGISGGKVPSLRLPFGSLRQVSKSPFWAAFSACSGL